MQDQTQHPDRDRSGTTQGENLRGAPTEDSPAREPTERIEEMQRVEAERRHTREVREDAESRRDLESPRSPDQLERDMGADHADGAGHDEVRARERRDREEMGRPSKEGQDQAMQEDLARRREQEAEHDELR